VSMKNPLTLLGIEPTTFRFVEQHLNHCATAIPGEIIVVYENCKCIQRFSTVVAFGDTGSL